MATLFIKNEQCMVLTEEDFRRLVHQYMGDDAADYFKNHFNYQDGLIDELRDEIDYLQEQNKIDGITAKKYSMSSKELLRKCLDVLSSSSKDTELCFEIDKFLEDNKNV